jgi:uncharacterized protein (UPF0332 family)
VSASQFDPRAFFTLAQSLGTTGQPEECRRTAVSRAYYACFHVARMALERGGRWQAGTTNSHQTVISELRRRNRRHLSVPLDVLRRLREHADYVLHTPLDERACQEALDKAADLLRLLDRF